MILLRRSLVVNWDYSQFLEKRDAAMSPVDSWD